MEPLLRNALGSYICCRKVVEAIARGDLPFPMLSAVGRYMLRAERDLNEHALVLDETERAA